MKVADHMPPGQWLALKTVFAHVTNLFGDDSVLALNDIKRVLADAQVIAMVRNVREAFVRYLEIHGRTIDGLDDDRDLAAVANLLERNEETIT